MTQAAGAAPAYRAFADFFKAATGNSPYAYQEYLSRGDIGGVPDVLGIPTGAGKTEAAVLSVWLWRRIGAGAAARATTPRRLVYCLPMRTLVEQTRDRISGFLERLRLGNDAPMVATMMGGDADSSYRTRPDRDMIIVGTQDMLLSRSLNRGYALTPFMWPVEFAAMNNDCLWVLDEVQLMEDGLATSAQLDAFRRALGTFGPHKTIWMSATVDLDWLDTVDNAGAARTALALRPCAPAAAEGGSGRGLDLFLIRRQDGREEEDLVDTGGMGKAGGAEDALGGRCMAQKTLHVHKGIRKSEGVYTKADAKKIWDVVERKGGGPLTLIIVNTVKRAQSLHAELKVHAEAGGRDLMLAHSRFRRPDRRRILDRIRDAAKGNGGRETVVVSTQVIEAGVDMSARLLITEAAPWPSLVQRFGRCNRAGDLDGASICVIPMSPKANAPYSKADMGRSEEMLGERDGKPMPPILAPRADACRGGGAQYRSVLRRRDLLGLFDTSPDLSGGYTDVARYVRSVDDARDVHVFWRRWDDGLPPARDIQPASGEMCTVPLSDLAAYAASGTGRRMHRFDHTDGSWAQVRPGDARPGQTLLLRAADGGYSEEGGWDPSLTDPVRPGGALEPAQSAAPAGEADSVASDPSSLASRPIPLCEHTEHVVERLGLLGRDLGYVDWPEDDMRRAAVLHDLGKAHPVFQNAMREKGAKEDDRLWAKSGGTGWRGYKHPATGRRIFFRHEAVSATAILNEAGPGAGPRDFLVAYVVAAHHGKVRMSMRNPPAKVRSGRYDPYDPRFVAGVCVEDDPAYNTIPNFLSRARTDGCPELGQKLGGWAGQESVEVGSDMGRIGAEPGHTSWLRMAQGLLADHGPFRLAFLESALRIADMVASAGEDEGGAS